MYAMIENHEKSSLISILFNLTAVECAFKKASESCPLENTVEMTKQEQYRRLNSMALSELEDLYQNHCQCALKV